MKSGTAKFLVPVTLFGLLVIIFYVGLYRDPTLVPPKLNSS